MATCPDCGRAILTERPHRHPSTGYLPGMAYGTGGNRLDAARAETPALDEADETDYRQGWWAGYRTGYDAGTAGMPNLATGEPAETPALDVERLAEAMVRSGLMRRYADYANSLPTMTHGTDEELAPEWAAFIAREYARLTEEAATEEKSWPDRGWLISHWVGHRCGYVDCRITEQHEHGGGQPVREMTPEEIAAARLTEEAVTPDRR